VVHRIRTSLSHQISYAFLDWRQIVADRLFCKLLMSLELWAQNSSVCICPLPLFPGATFARFSSENCCLPEAVKRRCSQQVVDYLPNQTLWEWGSCEQASPCQLRLELHGMLLLLTAAGEIPGFDLLPCCLARKGSSWSKGKRRAAC